MAALDTINLGPGSTQSSSSTNGFWSTVESVGSTAIFAAMLPAGILTTTAVQQLVNLWSLAKSLGSSNSNRIAWLTHELTVAGMTSAGASLVAQIVGGVVAPVALGALSGVDANVWNRIAQLPSMMNKLASGLKPSSSNSQTAHAV